MSMKIYKYQLNIGSNVVNARIRELLHVAYQGPTLFVWALVDTHFDPRHHDVHVIGTGHDLPPGVEAKDYIGTVHDAAGFVWHVFDGGPA